MGQKTHPVGLRLGIVKTWDSRWYAGHDYPDLLEEDLMIRKYLDRRLSQAGVSKVVIERKAKKVTIVIHTARPGIVIGRKGAQVDQIRDELQTVTGRDVYVEIQEVDKPEVDARLVGEHISRQLSQRVGFRRAMKKAVSSAIRRGALGIRVECSGRLGGSEMARREKYLEGRVPLHTLRADIDYAQVTCRTTYGTIGVKVWIFKGEILTKMGSEKEHSMAATGPGSAPKTANVR
ncbi:MAG: 30S ribosomal protein S3 [Gemmatimonadetes bacterium]|nr:30S ribosomal protein S3 [Gemmatimonadota bacterium]